MQTAMFRPAAFRLVPRPVSRLPNPSVHRRNYASLPKPQNSENRGGAGYNGLPIFIVGGVIFLMVGGRYIFASDKNARSGQIERSDALNKMSKEDMGNQIHDMRDSGVKTVEQKKEKEQKKAQSS